MKGAKFLAAREQPEVRVKCCGLNRVEEAMAAAQLGVDAIGLVFYRHSPRRVSMAAAREISSALPREVARVGLFVNAPISEVEAVLAEVPLDLLQFHGDETPAYCGRFGRPYLKALRLSDAGPHPPYPFTEAFALLLDSFQERCYGGTGKTFAWSLARDFHGARIVLAGGLDAANVAQAIRATTPYAVDVSSGVEAAPGRKDTEKIAFFLREVKNAFT